MVFEGFPTGGWRGKVVPVARPANTPAVLVVRSRGPVTGFFVHPVIDTRGIYDEDPMLLQTTGTAPIQFVLPAKYTHVKIQRGSSEGNGFARWHLDRVAIDDLRPLRGRVAGTGGEVLTWRGEERSIRFDFPAYKHGHRNLEFFSFENGERISIDREGSTRGTAVIPGPGFIRIQAVQGWKIEAN